MPGDRSRLELAEDRRAYVPFAVIGIFLLLTSVTVIAVLETRSDPEIDTSSAQAYDRTSSAAQSALVRSTSDALQRAAANPVTDANTSTPVGSAIDGGTRDEIFTNYVKLLVYLEARDSTAASGQRLPDGTVSTVSLPDYSHPQQAVDNITLHVGGDRLDYGDPGGADLPHGSVRATIPDVTVTVEEDGTIVGQRTEDYTVTVGSSVFELHNLTTQYEDALKTDFGEERGLADHLSARLYRFAYLRGHEQSEGAPIPSVLEERHVETLGNDAVYATQREVFGNQDTYANRSLVRAYACMLGQDYHDVYDYSEIVGSDVDRATDRADETDYCSTPELAYGDLSPSLSGAEPPDWSELVDDEDYLGEPVELNLSQVASASMGEAAAEDAVETAIDRVYDVDVYVESDIEWDVLAGAPPSGSNADVTDYSIDGIDDETVTVRSRRLTPSDAPTTDQAFYQIDVAYTGEFSGDVTWGGSETVALEAYSVTYDATFLVTGNHSRDTLVDDLGIEQDFVASTGGSDSIWATNFEGVPERALRESIEGVDSQGVHSRSRRHEQIEEAILQNSNGVSSSAQLRSLVVDGSPTLEVEPTGDGDRLRGWVVEDLVRLDQNLSDVSTGTIERADLLEGPSPITDLETQIENDDWVYDTVDGSYVNAPDKVRAEARLEYLNRVRDEVETTRRVHESTLSDIDAQITSHTAADRNETVRFARNQTTSSHARPLPDLVDHDILEDVQIVPDGEPTYLTLDTVDASQVPAVEDPPNEFAPAVASSGEVYTHPHEHGVGPNEVRLRTAGEVLEAAKAADDASPSLSLSILLEPRLEAEIDDIVEAAAREAYHPFQGSDADVERADIEAAIHDELERVGPTERQAIYLGGGEPAIDRIAANVSDKFSSTSGHGYDYSYREGQHPHLENAIRHGLEHEIPEGVVGDRNSVASLTETVDDDVRIQVADGATDAYRDRLNQTADTSPLEPSTNSSTGEEWLESNRSASDYAANRVPAGVPVVDRPKFHELTANLWNVHLAGEYKRFTVRASEAEALPGAATNYVRTNGTVTVTWDGTEQVIGETEPLSFDTRTSVLVAVPADGLGVGDRTDDADWCSSTYDETGRIDASTTFHACAP